MPLPRTLRRVAAFLRLQDIAAFRLCLVEGLADRESAWADCGRGPKVFTIRLDASLARDYPEVAALLVIHEASHIVTWDALGTDHGAHFGLAYSMLYRLWMSELD